MHEFAKIYGWDLDYIENLSLEKIQILIECINIERERQRTSIRLAKMKGRMKR